MAVSGVPSISISTVWPANPPPVSSLRRIPVRVNGVDSNAEAGADMLILVLMNWGGAAETES